MPLNLSLLVSAEMMQDYFVDNILAKAMAAGTITMYQDSDRTTLKNWYYQSGVPGRYEYIQLPNPLTLSAIGTITDANGDDLIPFYYPVNEDDNTTPEFYFITVDNSDGLRQFTRGNFPYLGQGGGSGPTPPSIPIPTLNNYIINNRFWRNIGQLVLNGILSSILSPSQHDGFRFPDFQFVKNIIGASEVATFLKLPIDTIFVNDISPEYYLNHTCTIAQAGETLKCYQFPISLHVNTLQNLVATVTIQAKSPTSDILTLSIFQDLGTGVLSPDPIIISTIELTPEWTKYEVEFTFPSGTDVTLLSKGSDDGYYLQIGMPLSFISNIDFAIPCLYLSNKTTLPTNTFDTYDEIDQFINSPRTGDILASINSFNPFGWVPMNDGVLALNNPSMLPNYARTNGDVYRLYDLIWTVGKPHDTGLNFNPVAQMYDSTGALINYGTNSYVDFTMENALGLTRMFGRVVSGSVPIIDQTIPFTQTVTFSNISGLLTAITPTSIGLYNTQPITFISGPGGVLPANIISNRVYYIVLINYIGPQIFLAESYADSISNPAVLIPFIDAGTTPTINMFTNISGTYIGEQTHVLTVGQLASHDHFEFQIPGMNGPNASSLPTLGAPRAPVSTTGNDFPHNNIQPATFYNRFIKL
jgi:hypothetical protein